MAVGDAYVFPGFLTPVLTQLFFRKPLTTFLTYFFPRKKSRLDRGSNSHPPGHESDTDSCYQFDMKVIISSFTFYFEITTSPVFMCLQYKSFENTVEKGGIAQCFLQRFLPFWITFYDFYQI